MGLLSFLGKSADEGAQAASDAGKYADDSSTKFVSNDETPQGIGAEATDGINTGGGFDYSDESFGRRVFADFGQRVADGSNPRAVVDEATSKVPQTAKYGAAGAVGVTSLWAGQEVVGDISAMQTAESKEQTYKEYQKALKAIRNNPNLSPEQKEERIQALKEAYNKAIENAQNGGAQGTLTDVMNDLMGGMGMMDKLLIGIALIVAVKVATKYAEENY